MEDLPGMIVLRMPAYMYAPFLVKNNQMCEILSHTDGRRRPFCKMVRWR